MFLYELLFTHYVYIIVILVMLLIVGIRVRSTNLDKVKVSLPRRAVTTYIKGPTNGEDLPSPVSRVSLSPQASINTRLVFSEHL